MAFRAKKAAFAFVILAQAAAAQEFSYAARHDHLRKSGAGTMVIGADGLSFREAKGDHRWTWKWQDVQRLDLAPRKLRVVTYRDSKWKLGADREYRFELDPPQTFQDAYEFLKGRLDQRLVAEVADPAVEDGWSLSVKHLQRFGGTLGVLEVGSGRVVFKAGGKGESRTWRYGDIGNISRSGPFELTITSLDKTFNFQLREPLSEARYNELWREVNRAQGLQFLTSYQEGETIR